MKSCHFLDLSFGHTIFISPLDLLDNFMCFFFVSLGFSVLQGNPRLMSQHVIMLYYMVTLSTVLHIYNRGKTPREVVLSVWISVSKIMGLSERRTCLPSSSFYLSVFKPEE